MRAGMALDTTGIDAARLRRLLDGEYAETRDRVRRALDQERFAPVFDLPMRLSSTASEAVLKTVNGVLAGLRPHAGALVEAFGIPERQLAAGIGRGPGS